MGSNTTVFRIFLMLSLILLFKQSISQKEANIWYFGGGAGLDFNGKVPNLLRNGKMSTVEGSSSICDDQGNLLFYSDGLNVWDKTHSIMPYGHDLKGNQSSTQACLIVRKPLSNTNFYLFISQEQTEARNGKGALYYSEIDMRLNSGNGDILPGMKNILLTNYVSEKLCGVAHSNGKDVWVISYKLDTDTIYSYKITNIGIDRNPVKSPTGVTINEGNNSGNLGQLKISPDGTKIACASYSDSTHANFVADFNASNGKISHVKKDYERFTYGVEFSPLGKYLYFTQMNRRLIQFDATAATEKSFQDSKITIESDFNAIPASLQLGPDQKIYMAAYASAYVHVIHAPDSKGLNCQFEKDFIHLEDRLCLLGLPNFVASYFDSSNPEENKNYPDMRIFPNPGSGKFTLTVKSPEEDMGLTIYNDIGQKVYESIFDRAFKTFELDVATGIYFLRLTKSNTEFVSKFSVLK